MTGSELTQRIEELEVALAEAEANASEQNIELIGLLEVSIALNDAAAADQMLEVVSSATRDRGATTGKLWWVSPDAQGSPSQVELVAQWDSDTECQPCSGRVWGLTQLPYARCWADEADEPTLIGDVAADERLNEAERSALASLGVGALALLPLCLLGQWQGLISFEWSERHEFSGQASPYFKSLMAITVGTVANRRLVDSMERTIEIRTRELEEKLQIITRHREAILELSTPVLEVWDDILVLPIVGVVDTKRSMEIMDNLLNAIVAKQSRCVILDVTGVEIVDTKTADYLLKVTRASGLLGTRCVLTGLSPAVAQTLVEIGAELSELRTLRNLKDGLRDCLRHLAQAKQGHAAAPT